MALLMASDVVWETSIKEVPVSRVAMAPEVSMVCPFTVIPPTGI
jgi:hypothetical protein